MRLLPFVLVAWASSASAGPERLAKKFERAANSHNYDAIAAMCSPEFLDRASLDCRRLIKEMKQVDATVTLTDIIVDKPTSITQWTLSPSPESAFAEVVSIWLMVERTRQGWRFVDGRDAESTSSPPASDHLQIHGLPDGALPILSAMQRGDRDQLVSLSTADLQAATTNTPADFASQVRAKDLSLQSTQVSTSDQRGVVTLQLLRDDRPVDEVFAYLSLTEAGWRLAAIDEDEFHAAAFVRGELPALQVHTGTPVPPGMQTLAARMTEALRDDSTDDVLASAPPNWLADLRSDVVPDAIGWWFEEANRGLLCWTRADTTMTAVIRSDFTVARYIQTWGGCKTDWASILED